MHQNFSQLTSRILIMGNKVITAVDQSIQAMTANDTAIASQVRQTEKLVDSMYYGINEQCLEIMSGGQFARIDINFIVNSLKIAMELERICDYANQIAKLVQKKFSQQDVQILSSLNPPAAKMKDQTTEMLSIALECYEKLDISLANRLIDADDLVDKKNRELFRDMLCVGSMHPWGQEVIMDYHVAIRYLERVADRAANIGELVHYIVSGAPVKKPAYEELIWDDN
ncbi:phosphate signaling complex protein PhoU [Acetonema longum]|uniref:Phosphate-specific transport system accessory protein PhoU n=1 Tax=Acetonema longum DSM 6540 TaxID=1009370 RepID=F7NQF5_9FIRM|nr:phosphate signaling complex protein PhoU [Acetonema longum]EGO61733.1 phosphate uptake regulator PhoU [Acetonema longum DSM 6540]